jgi:hypothetical protein
LLWPGKSAEPVTTPATLRQTRSANLHPSSVDKQASTNVTKTSQPRQRFYLSHAVELNPFDPPKTVATVTAPVPVLTSIAVKSPTEPIEAAKNEDVAPAPVLLTLQAIFFDNRGAAALVEDRILRVGDELPDGRQVLRITSNGVELTP